MFVYLKIKIISWRTLSHRFALNQRVLIAVKIFKNGLDAIRSIRWCLAKLHSAVFKRLIRAAAVQCLNHAESILANVRRKPGSEDELNLLLLSRRNRQPTHSVCSEVHPFFELRTV